MRNFIVFLLLTVFLHVSTLFGTLTASDEDDHGGDIIYTKPLKAVLFSHENHSEEAGLDCDSCHDEVFPMEALESQENEDFTMESLYEGKYCGSCHDGETAFASDTQCASCHIGVKGYERSLKQEGDPGKSEH
jgi:c(7)-type cytochrome triheme protein